MRKAAKGSKLQPEYDFSQGARGKFARRYEGGTNVVVLDPDVARAFPNAAAVNQSLRALRDLVRMQKRTRVQSAVKSAKRTMPRPACPWPAGAGDSGK